MSFFEDFGTENKLADWEERIEKTYACYGVNISIKNSQMLQDRAVFILKLKGKTRETHIFAHARDVQLRLKFPVFSPIVHNFNIYLIVSDQRISYDHLPQILADIDPRKEMRGKCLPFVLGYDVVGKPFIADLASFPHLLVGGSSNSGKSVGLQALIAGVTYFRSPNEVNFILIDVGATSLMPFEEVPHLSCPIIRDMGMAYQTLIILKEEMERRIDLQTLNIGEFQKLPRLVLVIDEFPALLMGTDVRQVTKSLVNVISSLLQRGRHAGIHVVLSAQNPTFQNMRVDLGNITARMAFRCAKKNFSEIILGEGGAENLLGQGDMYFKAPYYDGLQRIQGAFISSLELQQTVNLIKQRWRGHVMHKFVIPEAEIQRIEFGGKNDSVGRSVAISNRLFADVILWTLGQKSISCNVISETFSVGWRRANGFIRQLNEYGIVGNLDAKLPRKVLPQAIGDVPTEVMNLLENNGFSAEEVSAVICSKTRE